jgi:hypothetical protein
MGVNHGALIYSPFAYSRKTFLLVCLFVCLFVLVRVSAYRSGWFQTPALLFQHCSLTQCWNDRYAAPDPAFQGNFTSKTSLGKINPTLWLRLLGKTRESGWSGRECLQLLITQMRCYGSSTSFLSMCLLLPQFHGPVQLLPHFCNPSWLVS